MNQEQKNFSEMLGELQQHFDAHRPFWSSVGPVADSIDRLANTRRELALGALVQNDGSGTKEAKDLALGLAAEKSYLMGRRVLAWAKKNARADIATAVDLNRAELAQGAEATLLERQRRIFQYAKDNRDQLADYKVTDESLDALDSALNTFAALRAGHKEKENHRIYSTARIEELIDKARAIIDILDDEVEGLIDNREFIDTYFIARRKTDRRATRAAMSDTAAPSA
ncbi:hypothetical protein [Flaviaesturariibacter amylovorans]|uniref:DUF4254 domain-containing protein n=1 Tax=Flaviaesturariibacter amylovorans TaxID=1084520 RepID=A0ABP8HNN0_9BACT